VRSVGASNGTGVPVFAAVRRLRAVRCGDVWSVGRPATRPYPGLAIGSVRRWGHDAAMELISATTEPARRPMGPIVSGTLVGAVLVAGGLSLAYLVFATPLLGTLLPSGRIGPGQMVTGMVVMALALVAPATFVAVGTSRLAKLLASLRLRGARQTTLERLAALLPSDVVAASDVPLHDGRTIPGLLIGPFGVIVLRDAPPSAVTRISGSHWELRTARGWTPIENPFDRATRDAERVRQWLSHDDRDFLVKTYAAVISPANVSLARSATCAVLTVEQVPAFIASLTAQRSLTTSRREGIMAQVREAVERA